MSKAVIALAVATMASAGASTYLWQELDAEREQSVALQTRVAELERAQSQPAAPPPIAAPEPPQPDIEQAPPPQGTTAKPALVAQSASGALFGVTPTGRLGGFGPADPEIRKRMMEAHEQQLRMLKDPDYRELMRTQQKLGMARVYSDLEPLLGLTKEESERLLDVLAEQSVRGMEQRPSFEPVDGTPSEAEMRTRQRSFEEQRRQNEAEIAAVLGSRYGDWQEYQKNGWSRSQVTRLRQTLSSTDEPLRQDQIKPLVEAIAREQEYAMAPLRSTPRPDAQAQVRFAEEWLERMAQSHERVRSAASGLLTPTQLEQLQRQQEQELKMQELSVKQQRARADAIARGELPANAPGTINPVISYSN